MRNSLRAILALALVCAVRHASATERISPRLVGLSESGAASAGGLDALGTNPSLLGRSVSSFELTLYPLGGFVVPLVGLGNASSAFTMHDLDLLLSRLAVTLQYSDRTKIVNAIGLGGAQGRVEGMIAAAVVRIGSDHAIGAHISQHGNAKYALQGGIDRALDTIAQTGNLFSVLLRNPIAAEAVWYNEFAFSYAYAPVDERGAPAFGVGASVKFVQGLGYAKLDGRRLSTINLGFDPIAGSTELQAVIDYEVRTGNGGAFDSKVLPLSPLFTVFPHGVGSGVALDVGIMKAVPLSDDILTAALSVTDLGAIRWSAAPTLRLVQRVDTFKTSGSVFAVDTLRRYTGAPLPTGAFSTPLPAQLHLAFSLDAIAPRGLAPRTVSLEYSQGLADIADNSLSPRLAVGAEWTAHALRWQTGIAYNADEGIGISLGFGARLFDRVQVDAAIGRFNGLWESPQLVNIVSRIAWTM